MPSLPSLSHVVYLMQVDGDFEDWLEVLRLMYHGGVTIYIVVHDVAYCHQAHC